MDRRSSTGTLGEGQGQEGRCDRCPQGTHDVSIGTPEDRGGTEVAMGEMEETTKSGVSRSTSSRVASVIEELSPRFGASFDLWKVPVPSDFPSTSRARAADKLAALVF
jgi:hypothetical protein